MTLHLQLNSINELNLVTDDLVLVEDPIYLWRFVNEQTKVQDLIELINELRDNQRGDRFILSLPEDLDLTTGEYRYFVYLSDTPGDEDFENMELLATSRALIPETFAENKIYEPEGIDIVYKGFAS